MGLKQAGTSKQKVALVTGASSGIGEAAAEHLVSAGFKVYGTSRRSRKGTARTFEMIALDVTDDASIETAVAEVLKREGQIDVLVNNAGFGERRQPPKKAPSNRRSRSSIQTSSAFSG